MGFGGVKLAEGFVEFTAEDGPLQDTIGNVGKSLDGLETKFASAAKFAQRTLLIGGAAVGFVTKQASDAEEAGTKFVAVFKEEADAAEEFAQTLGKSVGRSEIELKGMLSTLQDTFVPLGFARKEAREMSQQLVELSIDLASFNNEAEPEVLQRLQSAMIGNAEGVKRYGVILNQAALSQELMNMGIRGGTKNATEQQKAQARLAVLLRSTTDAQGDALRTADGLANMFKRMQSEIKDTSIEIGNAFIPIAKEMVGEITKALPKFKEWVIDNKELIASSVVLAAKIAIGVIAISKMITLLNVLVKTAPLAAGGLSMIAKFAAFTPVGMVALVTATVAFGIAMKKANEEIDKAERRLKKLNETQEALSKSAEKIAKNTKQIREAEADFNKTGATRLQQAEAQLSANEAGVRLLEAQKQRAEALLASNMNNMKVWMRTADSIDEIDELLDQANAQLSNQQKRTQAIREAEERAVRAKKNAVALDQIANKLTDQMLSKKVELLGEGNALEVVELQNQKERLKLDEQIVKLRQKLADMNVDSTRINSAIKETQALNEKVLKKRVTDIKKAQQDEINDFVLGAKQKSVEDLKQRTQRLLGFAKDEETRKKILEQFKTELEGITAGGDIEVKSRFVGLQDAFKELSTAGDMDSKRLEEMKRLAEDTLQAEKDGNQFLETIANNTKPAVGGATPQGLLP